MKTTFISLFFITLSLFSCKKDDANAKFVGTYTGTLDYTGQYNGPATLQVTAGSGAGDITLVVSVGTDYSNAITATVSGNTLTVPNQVVYINQHNATEYNGSGSLSGNTLTFSLTACNGGCVFAFSGSK